MNTILDKLGRELKVGDLVRLEASVVKVFPKADQKVNVHLRLVGPERAYLPELECNGRLCRVMARSGTPDSADADGLNRTLAEAETRQWIKDLGMLWRRLRRNVEEVYEGDREWLVFSARNELSGWWRTIGGPPTGPSKRKSQERDSASSRMWQAAAIRLPACVPGVPHDCGGMAKVCVLVKEAQLWLGQDLVVMGDADEGLFPGMDGGGEEAEGDFTAKSSKLKREGHEEDGEGVGAGEEKFPGAGVTVIADGEMARLQGLVGKAEAMQEEKRCPTCQSAAPHLHPAVQFEGEVNTCPDEFHLTPTPQNTENYVALVRAERERRGLGGGSSAEKSGEGSPQSKSLRRQPAEV